MRDSDAAGEEWATASLPEDRTGEGDTAAAPSGHSGLEAGRVVAQRYRLDRLLGEGGMGSVWAATHLVTHKPVALKLLKAGPTSSGDRRRLLREARAVCAVRHPNVVAVHDLLEDEAGPVLVMDLLEGETLADRLARTDHMSLTETLDVLLPVTSAVAAAHTLGIVHRDLKPANVFLAREPGGAITVKVVDFGIAKLATPIGDESLSRMTDTGAVLGTPCYMAPEQAFGENDLDHRADIWALGIMLYQCLSGVLPTRGDNFGQIFKIIVSKPLPPIESVVPELPGALVELIRRMLDRDREARPAALHEVAEVLAACLGVPTPRLDPPAAELLSQRGAELSSRAPANLLATDPALAETTSPSLPADSLVPPTAVATPAPTRGLLFAGVAVASLAAAAIAALLLTRQPAHPAAAQTGVLLGGAPATTTEPTHARAVEPATTVEAPSASAEATSSATATVAPSAALSGKPRATAGSTSAAATPPAASPKAAPSTKNLGSAVVKTPPF